MGSAGVVTSCAWTVSFWVYRVSPFPSLDLLLFVPLRAFSPKLLFDLQLEFELSFLNITV